MTDRRPLPQPPPARLVALSSLALFAVIALLLALRLLAGHDPALAAGTSASRAPAPIVAPPAPDAAASSGAAPAPALPSLVTRAS